MALLCMKMKRVCSFKTSAINNTATPFNNRANLILNINTVEIQISQSNHTFCLPFISWRIISEFIKCNGYNMSFLKKTINPIILYALTAHQTVTLDS